MTTQSLKRNRERDRYVKRGSTVQLKCVITQSLEEPASEPKLNLDGTTSPHSRWLWYVHYRMTMFNFVLRALTTVYLDEFQKSNREVSAPTPIFSVICNK
ncbi:hypothetical protein NQ317_001042 [Molorchus minor]|uniref:Ig-like domain-containing protein n=1 Tax=Molorchus minor TaxID=1323400 RepID=A0ABQ9IVR1_9CUCU|nr:hypothetical protein NQ317_001042 [Molorchus minor]